jgi:hypothetical protein
MPPTAALTWADVVKLCIPFVFSLVLLWAKQVYENRVERKSKSEMLWRAIDQDSTELGKALDELDHIANAYTHDRMRLVTIVVPQVTEVGARMAELDPAHAYVFSDYTAQAEIVRSGLARLERLTDRAIEAGKGSPGSLAKAIAAQVKSSKRDFVSMAQSALEVLKILKASNRSFDGQPISRRESVIRELKTKIQNDQEITATSNPGVAPDC